MSKTKQTRILILAEDKFPPYRVDVATLFGTKLAGRGYCIDWILQSEKECKKSYQTSWCSGKVWVSATNNGITPLHRIKKHALKLWNELRIFRLVREKKYHIIQVKDDFIPALFAITAAQATGAKFVYWLSYPLPESDIYEAKARTARYPLLYLIRGTIFKFILYNIILPASAHIFVQSEQMKKDIVAKGIDSSKLTAVPMGVEIERIPYQKTNIDVFDHVSSRKGNMVLYLGTLIKVRRLDFLLHTLLKVLKQEPHTKLYFVGDGESPSDRIFLKETAEKLKIQENVIFTGFLPMFEAWEFVRRADVCVSPFYPTFILNSTSPTKLIEYMAMGKPVVANNHPEQSLVLSESKAGICVPYQTDAFAEAIVMILQNPALGAEMGENGRRYVTRHRTYDVIAQTVDEKYKEICNENTFC